MNGTRLPTVHASRPYIITRQRERRQRRRARRFEALPRSLLLGRLQQGAAGSLADLRAAARLHRPPAIVCGVRLPAHHLPHLDHGRRDGAARPAGGGGAALRLSWRQAPRRSRRSRRPRCASSRRPQGGLQHVGFRGQNGSLPLTMRPSAYDPLRTSAAERRGSCWHPPFGG